MSNVTDHRPGAGHQEGWWWMAVRPRTLGLSAVPVVVGGALASAEGVAISWSTWLVTLFCALAIQVGTNLFNDVSDAMRGNDGADRIGPRRATASGLAYPAQVRRAAIISFLFALVSGIHLVWVGGWPILVLGLVSLAAGWAYSGGTRPLSYTAWGEILVIVFFGVGAVAGSYYLQGSQVAVSAIVSGIALGMPAAAVLLVNNVRDIDTDIRAGRRTLAALLGPGRSRWAYLVLMLLPFMLLPATGHLRASLLVLPVLPLCLWLVWRFLRRPGGAWLNTQLAHTAQAQFVLGALFSIGLMTVTEA